VSKSPSRLNLRHGLCLLRENLRVWTDLTRIRTLATLAMTFWRTTGEDPDCQSVQGVRLWSAVGSATIQETAGLFSAKLDAQKRLNYLIGGYQA